MVIRRFVFEEEIETFLLVFDQNFESEMDKCGARFAKCSVSTVSAVTGTAITQIKLQSGFGCELLGPCVFASG